MISENVLVDITSDVKGKLNKIHQGVVFNEPLTFISELLQNAHRANAKNVIVDISENMIRISDDGVGSSDYKSILTLDYSSWESTNEGFGIGFWSVLAIPNIQKCVVGSKSWQAIIDVDQLFKTGTPKAQIEKRDYKRGFDVCIISDYINEHHHDIRHEFIEIGQYQNFKIFFNGVEIPHKNIIEEVSGKYVYDANSRSFKARLYPQQYDSPCIYYENRYVCNLSELYGVYGNISIGANTLNLKEPDRKSIVKDEKYKEFLQSVKQKIKETYINFIKNASQDEIDNFSYEIDNYLNVNEYEKFIDFGSEFKLSDNDNDIDNSINDDSDGYYNSVDTNAIHNSSDKTITSKSITSDNISKRMIKSNKKLLDSIDMSLPHVWLGVSEIDELSDIIAEAKYYNINVLYAKNVLYERVYRKYNIPHINELKDNIYNIYKIDKLGTRSQKEESYIKLLQPICNHYNLNPDTFQIGNIKMELQIKLNDKIVHKKKVETEGICKKEACNRYIVLDRKHLKLSRFHLYGDVIGQHEYKALLATLPVISHELAHLMYNTVDNTVDHFKCEDLIYREIVKLYLGGN